MNRRTPPRRISSGPPLRMAWLLALFAVGMSFHPRAETETGHASPRPNILLIIADDASWNHFGAYGNPAVRTPNFDRIAREGARFDLAFCSSPSCTPSRGALLTGQDFWRLGEGANLWSRWPNKEPVYPALLEAAGYVSGHHGKGWSPGEFKSGGAPHNPAGRLNMEFPRFLKEAAGRPFCFWLGSVNPHRPYRRGSGIEAGLDPEKAAPPPFLPDTPEVRSDLLDYYAEIEAFDAEIGRAISALEEAGLLDNTLIAVTSDNGFPFPRGKTHLYDAGSRMPLLLRWPARIKPGLVCGELVGHIDLAPTFLEAAGVAAPEAMTGRSLWPLLAGGPDTPPLARAGRVFLGRERHALAREGDVGYPMRAIRTADWLYIRNFEPDRWPAGDPPVYGDLDPHDGIAESAAKRSVVEAAQPDGAGGRYFDLCLGKRPAEELYRLAADPWQMENLAGKPEHEEARRALAAELEAYARQTGDPRAAGGAPPFDQYPRTKNSPRGAAKPAGGIPPQNP